MRLKYYIRAIEVLIDQDVVRQGIGDKEPWKFFDLGHGYCTSGFTQIRPYAVTLNPAKGADHLTRIRVGS